MASCSHHVGGNRRVENGTLLGKTSISKRHYKSSQEPPLEPILRHKNPVHIFSRHYKKPKIIFEETMLYFKTRRPSCVETYFQKMRDLITHGRWKLVLRNYGNNGLANCRRMQTSYDIYGGLETAAILRDMVSGIPCIYSYTCGSI